MAEIPQVTARSRQRHEGRDVHIKPLLILGIGLIVVSVGVLLLVEWTFDVLSARRAQQNVPPSALAEASRPFPQPHLQIAPAQALRKLRAEEDAVLSSYAWVDRANGIVRIPIERAIDLLVERGLPAPDTETGGS